MVISNACVTLRDIVFEKAVRAHYWNRKFTSKSLGYSELDSTGMSLGDFELVYAKLRMTAETLGHGKNHG